MCSRRRLLLFGVVLCFSLAGASSAKVFHSQKEGLALAFPEADRIEQRTYILGPEEVKRVETRARGPLESKIVKLSVGLRGETVLGYAWLDVHTVRSLPEALLVVLTPEGKVRRLRVLAFHEPLDYLPTVRWFAQLEGRDRADRLKIGDDVHGVAGATLSTRAVTASVRRAIALHEILIAGGGEPVRSVVEPVGAGESD